MTIERVNTDRRAGDRAMLRQWLEFHRVTLDMKCDGLTDEQLRARSVPPSSLSLIGLVRHMAEVERAWFRRRLAGEVAPARYYDDANPDGDFDDVDDADTDDAFTYWREECERAREIEASFGSLDDVVGELTPRWVMVHMIEEYARHNGHADLLRERIDGQAGD